MWICANKLPSWPLVQLKIQKWSFCGHLFYRVIPYFASKAPRMTSTKVACQYMYSHSAAFCSVFCSHFLNVVWNWSKADADPIPVSLIRLLVHLSKTILVPPTWMDGICAWFPIEFLIQKKTCILVFVSCMLICSVGRWYEKMMWNVHVIMWDMKTRYYIYLCIWNRHDMTWNERCIYQRRNPLSY